MNNSFRVEYEDIAECDSNLPAEEIRENEHPKLRLVKKVAQPETHLTLFSFQPEEGESGSPGFSPERDIDLHPDPQDSARSPLTIYFQSMSQFPLLNEEEEKKLAQGIKESEDEFKHLILTFKTLVEKELPRVIPSAKAITIRRILQHLSGAFGHFDDIIMLENKREKVNRLQKRQTHSPKTKQELEEKIYKIESEISKRITKAGLCCINANDIVKDLETLFVGTSQKKKQHAMIKELSKTLRGLEHLSKGIKTLKNKLVQANLRLVISIAKKYIQHGLPLSDLIQEGNLGLMRAIDTYDYRRGHRFITYATWWIRQAIIRTLDCQSRTIRTPVYVSEKLNQIIKVSKRLQQQSKREPTVREIAREANASFESIEKVMQSFKDAIPLDTFVEEESMDSINSFSVDGTNSVFNQAVLSNLSQVMEGTLSDLTQREREIVKLRFGIGTSHDHTLEEIGWQMDLTRERIRQILEDALNKLRAPKHIMELKDFM